MASVNKGAASENLVRARGYFEQVLALDPANIDAPAGTAYVDVVSAATFLSDEGASRCAAAEVTLTKVLSLVPNHALAQFVLGGVYIYTNRAAEGIAKCEHALALDRNLASAHAYIGLAKVFSGRAEETESHVLEALRLSPRDTMARRWMNIAGAAKLYLGRDEEAVAWFHRGIETNRNNPLLHFFLAAALAQLDRMSEARTATEAGLVLEPTFTLRRYRAGAPSDNPTYLAQRERAYDGMRKVGCPRNKILSEWYAFGLIRVRKPDLLRSSSQSWLVS